MVIAIVVFILLAAVGLVPLVITGALTRFFKRDGILVLAGLVAVIVGVLINFVADKKFWRLDLTAESKYSVTTEMRHIVWCVTIGQQKPPRSRIVFYAENTDLRTVQAQHAR